MRGFESDLTRFTVPYFPLFWVQLLKQQKDSSVMASVLKEIENMLARGHLDLPITLCFAVTREDDLFLHQLLKRGLDPNESDNNGHTALVCIFINE